MIKDYEVLQNAEILCSKKLVIWGAGMKGIELVEKLKTYAAEIEFVDSDEKKWGFCHGIPVYSPKRIEQYSRENHVIILSPNALDVQESILKQIAIMRYEDIDIYTRFAIEGAVCFLKNRALKTVAMESGSDSLYMTNVSGQDNRIDYLTTRSQLMRIKGILMAEMFEKSVYIYQSKKVGSVTLVRSLKAAGVYGVHVHSFLDLFAGEEIFIRDIIKKSSGKIITIVREPIARQISLLWHYWGKEGEGFLGGVHSLEELERQFYSPDNENEFEWYKNEFYKVLDINIYDYPFDCDLGYSIIEKDGIQVLILKLERMNSLKKVISDFLEITDFELLNCNVARCKNYRYAYENYLENVKIPIDLWEHYYIGNKYMDYFYSENEKKQFYKQWESHIVY